MGRADSVHVADRALVDELDARFRETCTHRTVEAAESAWPAELWDSLVADGFTSVGVPEKFGGSGGTIVDACAVLRAAGRYAAPVPLAESGLLGGWAALVLGAELPGGLTVVADAPGVRAGSGAPPRLQGRVTGVPWARAADHLVLALGGPDPAVVLVAAGVFGIEKGTNLAGEPRDDVVLDDVEPLAHVPSADSGSAREDLLHLGALSRAVLAAGALERIADLSIEYAAQRSQFGRPIARFQAVQQHLVTLAEISAMSTIAVEVAAAAAENSGGRYEIACAKSVIAGHSTAAVRAAHQTHGAMGMTREYPLHHASRRLWSWVSEYGDERFWSDRIGLVATRLGAPGFYPFITDPGLAL